MKIHDSQLAGLTGAGVGGAERSRAAEGATQTGTERTEQRTPDGDRVQLSLLSNALRSESEDTPERVQKVQELRHRHRKCRRRRSKQTHGGAIYCKCKIDPVLAL